MFNFYCPGCIAPGSLSAAAGLVAPETRLLNESSAAGWVNYLRDNLDSGVGQFNATVNGAVLNRCADRLRPGVGRSDSDRRIF